MFGQAKRAVRLRGTRRKELLDRVRELVEKVDPEAGVYECCDDFAERVRPRVRHAMLKLGLSICIRAIVFDSEGLIRRKVWAANDKVYGAVVLFEDTGEGMKLNHEEYAARPEEVGDDLCPAGYVWQPEEDTV